jgi:predicted Rossmann-fold nucleotide-binding protein
VISLCQLGLLSKPVVLVNVLGFYDLLAQFFEKLFRESFSKPEFRDLMFFAATPMEAVRALESWEPRFFPDKLFQKNKNPQDSL